MTHRLEESMSKNHALSIQRRHVFHSPRLLLVLPMPSLLLRAWAGLGLVATAAARPAKPNLVVFLQVRPTLSPRGGRAGQRPA